MNTQTMLTAMRRIRKMYECQMAPVLQTFDLTTFEGDIIGFLSNNPDMDTANHIVEYRMLPKANVSRAVDGLNQRGWIDLKRDEVDRRKIHLSLTESAQPAAQAISKTQRAFANHLTGNFTPEERDQLSDLLHRIHENAINAMEEI